MPQSQKYKDLK